MAECACGCGAAVARVWLQGHNLRGRRSPVPAAVLARRRRLMEALSRPGPPPTLRELATELGMPSSVVRSHLRVLEGLGYVRRGPPGACRTWTPTVRFVVLGEEGAP